VIPDEDALHVRFTYHPPRTVEEVRNHERVRTVGLMAAQTLVACCPPGRELSLALTKLEEAVMWANAAIARDQQRAPQYMTPLEAIARASPPTRDLEGAGG
jgi:hypothetical protein